MSEQAVARGEMEGGVNSSERRVADERRQSLFRITPYKCVQSNQPINQSTKLLLFFEPPNDELGVPDAELIAVRAAF